MLGKNHPKVPESRMSGAHMGLGVVLAPARGEKL